MCVRVIMPTCNVKPRATPNALHTRISYDHLTFKQSCVPSVFWSKIQNTSMQRNDVPVLTRARQATTLPSYQASDIICGNSAPVNLFPKFNLLFFGCFDPINIFMILFNKYIIHGVTRPIVSAKKMHCSSRLWLLESVRTFKVHTVLWTSSHWEQEKICSCTACVTTKR